MPVHGPLLIVANSARYLAQSAHACGISPLVVDAFADLDTRGAAVGLRQARSIGPRALAEAVQELQQSLTPSFSRWVYGAGFEADPERLFELADPARLSGNPPQVLARISRPESWFALLGELGLAHPETRFQPPPDTAGWLYKPAGGCGGLGVRPLSAPGEAYAGGCYQRFVDGPVVSLLFAADGRRTRVLGFNRVYALDPVAGDFRYAGAINGYLPGVSARAAMELSAQRLTEALGLRGINGLDFVLERGRPLLLELNARPPATLELYESALPGGGLQTHLDACAGTLPVVTTSDLVRGQRVLYAEYDSTVPALDWPAWCSDRPPAGSHVPAGAPLCGISAVGLCGKGVERALQQRAAEVRRRLDAGIEEAA